MAHKREAIELARRFDMSHAGGIVRCQRADHHVHSPGMSAGDAGALLVEGSGNLSIRCRDRQHWEQELWSAPSAHRPR